MINDDEIKKSRPKIDEPLLLSCDDIYKKFTNKKQKTFFKAKSTFTICIILIILITATSSLIISSNLLDYSIKDGEPDIIVDDNNSSNNLSDEQKLRKSKYVSGNKNYYIQRLKQENSQTNLEEEDYEEYIINQDLSNVDYYYEVVVDYQHPTMVNQTIIVKKGELFYPSIIDEGRHYMSKSGYIFDGWVINEDTTNIIDEPISIEEDCTFRASWCKKESYKTSLFSCGYYVKENNKAVITYGKLLDESPSNNTLKFPDMIGEYMITEISSAAFSQSKTAVNGEIIDPGNVNFKTIILPKYLEKIGYLTFERFVGLETLYIGEKLVDISGGAFSECVNLKEIIIDEKNQELAFEENCLFNKVNNTLIQSFNSKKLPEGIKIILDSAFAENKEITTLNLKGVERIEGRAFYGCSNLRVVINMDNLQYIGSYAFMKCEKLTSFSLTNNIKYLGVNPFNYCNQIVFNVSNNKYQLIDECIVDIETSTIICGMGSKIADASIIGKSSFQGNTKLEEAIFPECTTIIEGYAFEDAVNVKKVIIHDSLRNIGYASFKGCISLVDLILPKEVDELGNASFSGCSSLTEIILPEGLEIIPNSICVDCINLETVYLPTTATVVDDLAFGWCFKLKYVYGFNQIVEFRSSCFTDTNLIDLNFCTNEEVTIGWGSFRCSSAKIIKIPLNVVSIGTCAFDNSNNTIILLEGFLEDYHLGDLWAFGCAVYQNINLDKVHYTDEYFLIEEENGYMIATYFGNESVITIPSTLNGVPVTKLAGTLFKGNKTLKKIILGENIIEIGVDTFRDSTLEQIVFNDKLEKIGEAAFLNTHLEEIIMPNSVTEIGFGAFQQNNYLKKIIVSNGLKIVPAQMVWSCPVLEYVYLGDGVEVINEYAIYHCPNLKFLRVGPNLKTYYRILRGHTIDFPSVALVLGNVSYKDDGSCANDIVNVKIYFENTLDMTIFNKDYLYTQSQEEITYYLYEEWEYKDGYPVLKTN